MEELTLAQAIVDAADTIGWAIVIAAFLQGVLRK